MKLKNLSISIQQGAFKSRVEIDEKIGSYEYELFSMYSLSEEAGIITSLENKKTSEKIRTLATKNLPLAIENMVLVGLTSQIACVVTKEHVGKLIPSNFCYIIVDSQKLDPYFLMWSINYSKEIKKQMIIAKQGISLHALSINMLREFEITMIDLKEQQKIGRLYKSILQKKKVDYLLAELQEKILANYKLRR